MAPGWSLNGNTGTGTQFIGTTNMQSLRVRVNNWPSGFIDADVSNGNTFWGLGSGWNNTGRLNTGIGCFSLQANTTGEGNTANGDFSLAVNSTGGYNTAVGAFSLQSNSIGNFNTGVGFQALTRNSTGVANTAMGFLALSENTIGNDNVAIGVQSLTANTTGSQNVAAGTRSLTLNTTGSLNTAYGFQTMARNNTGSRNTGLGTGALGFVISGSSNTAVGTESLFNSLSDNNTAIGDGAMWTNTTGNNNTAIGWQSLIGNATGSNNTAIGKGANVSTNNLENATAIGANAVVDASNKVRIGNAAVTVIEGQVPFTSPSDGRFKFDLQEDVKGLDFILRLRPLTYRFDVQRFDEQQGTHITPASYNEAAQIRRTGFIAQEVEQAAEASRYNFSGIIKPKTEKEHYSLSYESFVVPLVKAVQELTARVEKKADQSDITKLIEKQQQMIEELNQKIAVLQRQVKELLLIAQAKN